MSDDPAELEAFYHYHERRSSRNRSATFSVSDHQSFRQAGEITADVYSSDMSDEMLQYACNLAGIGLQRFNTDRNVSKFLKERFDHRYCPTWHCIVGRNFGTLVSSEPHSSAYFKIGPITILLFRTQVFYLKYHDLLTADDVDDDEQLEHQQALMALLPSNTGQEIDENSPDSQ